jgi:hypothetical protein
MKGDRLARGLSRLPASGTSCDARTELRGLLHEPDRRGQVASTDRSPHRGPAPPLRERRVAFHRPMVDHRDVTTVTVDQLRRNLNRNTGRCAALATVGHSRMASIMSAVKYPGRDADQARNSRSDCGEHKFEAAHNR